MVETPLATPSALLSSPLLCSGGCSVKGRDLKRTWSVREHVRGVLRCLSSRRVRSDRIVRRTAQTLWERSGTLRQALSRRGVSEAATGLETASSKAFQRSCNMDHLLAKGSAASGARSNFDVLVGQRLPVGTAPTVVEQLQSFVYRDVVLL